MDGLIAYALAKKYAKGLIDEKSTEGFRIQVEQDRSILNNSGEEKVFYFLPKSTVKPSDGYDEFVYTNNNWEKVGATDVDLSDYATKEWTLEQIEDSVSPEKTVFVVNLTLTSLEGGVMDKTAEQIVEAYNQGKVVIFKGVFGELEVSLRAIIMAAGVEDETVTLSAIAITEPNSVLYHVYIPRGKTNAFALQTYELKGIASADVNENGTITFYDKDGNPLFTTTGTSVIGPQGNSVTSAEILNNHLILHIGVLQSDGTILDTPVNVGRVVGQDGAPGVSVTGATVNQQGHLIITLSDGTTIDAGYVGTPKTDIAGAVIMLSESTYTYDGTSKAPSVTSVTLNGQALTAGTDYAVVANPATNAGQYVVTVNGIGDYTGTSSTEWTITKAQATITGNDSITISWLDEPVSKTYTTNGGGAFSFTISGNIATINNSGGTVTITPTAYGTADLTVTVSEGQNYFGTTKTVSVTVEELQTQTVFGVVWDYSLSSPQLARLTPQTDPLGVVTTVPTQEPTACVGNDGNGQSDFDNYMPWSGMQRYNCVNGQVVDFVDYSNGETFVYIPEFWSKIVNDSSNSKMYFYISDSELNEFTKHPGSGQYVARYECNENFLSVSGFIPKVNTSLTAFRAGITSIDNKHFQYDFSTYNAIELLYIIEFANLNSQAKIGAGITSGDTVQATGQTDVLTYHTGRIIGTDNLSAIQYRWVENLWGNVWKLVDGVLIQDKLVYICNDVTKYYSTITEYYVSTGLGTPFQGWLKAGSAHANGYLIPLSTGGSDSTYLCDNCYSFSGLCALSIGGHSGSGFSAGLFYWGGSNIPDYTNDKLGGRAILILPSGGGE